LPQGRTPNCARRTAHDEQRLPELLNLKYHALADAETALGDVERIRLNFFAFQEKLYSRP
jgi:type I restriction enzyme R subunit